MILRNVAAAGIVALMSTTSVFADGHGCGISEGNISVIANDFPALRAVTEGAAACAQGDVTADINHNKDHKDLIVAALTANPSQYTAVHVSNSTLVTLMNDDLVRPLDDLIAAHGAGLAPSQLVTVDGKVMSVAFMANAQHLYSRTDLLKAVGKEIPTTYEEVLEAAEAIRASGAMEYPVALNTKAGWNLAEEFVNMYMGTGASLFEAGSAAPAINNANGVATLEMLKSLVAYSNPDFLTFDSNATQADWEAGNLALATMWGSRGGAVLDGEGSSADVVSATVLSGAPTWGGGDRPATTLWWDGISIARNASDADAEATFIALMNGLSDEVVTANNDAAVWLSAAYQASPASAGVSQSAMKGAAPYPMLPYMGTMHSALGAEMADFMQGKESAEQALADIEAAYMTAAKEKGFLQ